MKPHITQQHHELVYVAIVMVIILAIWAVYSLAGWLS